MIKQIRTSKFTKIVAYYLAIMMFVEITYPMQAYALTTGPKQPEFNSFTPLETSDMVDLSSGDFSYNIPVMDVGGYPINLSYASGSSMDQEASWTGLGWNLNVGQIDRQVRGLPDDFRGDEMRYENSLKDNITVGTNLNVSPALSGNDFPFNIGLGVQYNNYEGITFKPSAGVSYELAGCVSVGVNISGSTGEGATVSPSVGISAKTEGADCSTTTLSASFGVSLNSRKGLENMSLSASAKTTSTLYSFDECGNEMKDERMTTTSDQSLSLGTLSFNNQSYTPTKRIAFETTSKTFNATVGGEVFGVEGQVRITGYGSYQKLHPAFRNRMVGAYGYDNTHFKNASQGVLDFNREDEVTISKNTTVLPVTNYTYDTYNIEGQGVNGMFRPYRSQVGYLYNDEVSDYSGNQVFGAEIGLGNLVHGGVNFLSSPSTSTTGRWANMNFALPAFTESNTDSNKPLYQPVTYKMVGELDVDNELGLYYDKVRSNKPVRFEIEGGDFNWYLKPLYLEKTEVNNSGPSYTAVPIGGKIKRDGRLPRNQVVQKITNKEALNDRFITRNPNAKLHHTAGIKVLKTDGTTYVYGKAVYNKTKVEASFDVSGRTGDNNTGLVTYTGDIGSSGNHTTFSDRYINKITTPAYAHSYLITSVLSTDYEDIDDNGPSDNDLGSYTKFGYVTPNANYKWRTPYGLRSASYNEGLKSSAKDQKGNYIYGEKELTYLQTIETKNYIAFIDLDKRNDARAVKDEYGEGNDNNSDPASYMYCIKSIRLFSKPELKAANISHQTAANLANNISVKPIKTAHFDYNYELCKGMPNNFMAANDGKLTLKRLYFTYRGSNMGRYTPYTFDYGAGSLVTNPNYFIKGFDIWGNYMPAGDAAPLTNAEFPFVKQDKVAADRNTAAWILKSVSLPSGGRINIETESDDYKYVQNKRAMQMFKVVGAGNNWSQLNNNKLYEQAGNHYRYLFVQISNADANITPTAFAQKYLQENIGKPIFFRFLLNMAAGKSDFVTGYFEIQNTPQTPFMTQTVGNNVYAAIPLKFLRKEGGMNGSSLVNPIAKAGWGFGRTHLNRVVYSPNGDEVNDDFVSIVNDLVGSIGSVMEMFRGPNGMLETKGCAKTFDKQKSWIRLEHPGFGKLGGGLRVKKVAMSDNWDIMNGTNEGASTGSAELYRELYGQQYSYFLEDEKTTSGVATYEPNASAENALVEPFYGKDGNYADRIGSPKELNYAEKPFGETFFPSPRVTYSRVTVQNLKKDGPAGRILKQHATGKKVSEFYTSYDFPTIVNYTDLRLEPDHYQSPLLQMLDVKGVDHITATQGFTIETNDMNGKAKSEKTYAEGQDDALTRMEYRYNTNAEGKLDNDMVVLGNNGRIGKSMIGVNYDMVNDFNESRSVTQAFGGDGNIASFLVGIFPIFIPIIIPRESYNEAQLRTATTTKVIHRTAILKEKIAYDGGSRVSTSNLAWDAGSGQILLTQTINEFDDKYYTVNFPAYWYYKSMGMASNNIDMTGVLINDGNGLFYMAGQSGDLRNYFKIGDELMLHNGTKVWVTKFETSNTKIRLMKRDGSAATSLSDPRFKTVRSGNRNQQLEQMASITLMKNPIANDDGELNLGGFMGTYTTYAYDANADITKSRRIINASAVMYSDDWASQCENNLPNEQGLIDGIGNPVNPYLYNTKGDWRAIKSYSYLGGRNNFNTDNRRKAGTFDHFQPFYYTGHSGAFHIDSTRWTFASRVNKISPYGPELENKDALNRYSAAQHGYKYNLPMAVASNSRYSEIGFDGFEDYDNPLVPSLLKPHFGYHQGLNNYVSVSKLNSHTGKKSLAVKYRSKATFMRKVDGCKVPVRDSIPKQGRTSKTTTKK